MKKRHLLSVMMLGVSLLLIGCSAPNQQTNSSESPARQENTGQAAATSGTADTNSDADFKDAVEGYRQYVIEQSDLFVKATDMPCTPN